MTHHKHVIVIDLDCDHSGVSRFPWQLGSKAWRNNRTLDTVTHALHTILHLFLRAVSTVSIPFQLRLPPPLHTRNFNSFVLHFNSDRSSPLPTRSFNSLNCISAHTDLRLFLPAVSTASTAFQLCISTHTDLRLFLPAVSTASTAFQLRLISGSSYAQFQPFQLYLNSDWFPPLHEYAQCQPLQLYLNSDWSPPLHEYA